MYIRKLLSWSIYLNFNYLGPLLWISHSTVRHTIHFVQFTILIYSLHYPHYLYVSNMRYLLILYSNCDSIWSHQIIVPHRKRCCINDNYPFDAWCLSHFWSKTVWVYFNWTFCYKTLAKWRRWDQFCYFCRFTY